MTQNIRLPRYALENLVEPNLPHICTDFHMRQVNGGMMNFHLPNNYFQKQECVFAEAVVKIENCTRKALEMINETRTAPVVTRVLMIPLPIFKTEYYITDAGEEDPRFVTDKKVADLLDRKIKRHKKEKILTVYPLGNLKTGTNDVLAPGTIDYEFMPAQVYRDVETPLGRREAFGFVGKDPVEMQRKYLAGLLDVIERKENLPLERALKEKILVNAIQY